jgi:hypothetical protein
VNREITGIPLEAYWIQMQVQMEVCDLDECDFFETQFKEFDTSEEFFISDKEYTSLLRNFLSTKKKRKTLFSIILYSQEMFFLKFI